MMHMSLDWLRILWEPWTVVSFGVLIAVVGWVVYQNHFKK